MILAGETAHDQEVLLSLFEELAALGLVPLWEDALAASSAPPPASASASASW